MAKKRRLFKIRFKVNGKAKTFRTMAKSTHDAAKKMKSAGQIISITQEH
jgi:hypothetical protein